MARKTIHRDLHERNVKHSKAYSVVGQRGQLRVESAPEKVSKASEPKKAATPPPVEPTVKKETVEPDPEPVKVEKVEPKTESKAKKTTKAKKSTSKKTTRRGRPAKTTKVEEKAEDQLP